MGAKSVTEMGMGRWMDWAPVVTQGVSVSLSSVYGRYMRVGNLIVANFSLTISSAGTANNALSISKPVSTTAATGIIGTARYQDQGTAFYPLLITALGTFIRADAPATTDFGKDPNMAVANTDNLLGQFTYEVT